MTTDQAVLAFEEAVDRLMREHDAAGTPYEERRARASFRMEVRVIVRNVCDALRGHPGKRNPGT